MVGGRARMKRCLHAPAVRTYCGQNRRIVTDESSSECIVRIVVVDGWCITSRSQRFGFIQQQMPAALRTHFFCTNYFLLRNYFYESYDKSYVL